MTREITRRDFLNGTRVAIGASPLGPSSPLARGQGGHFDLDGDDDPPAATGLRGSHEGSWESMHARARGQRWSRGEPEERYDLVVVGGGISGLAAAHFYRKSRPDDPIVLHMCHVHPSPEIKGPEPWREARRRLLTTSFDEFEHHVRDQLDQALSSAGFDADRDILAIANSDAGASATTESAIDQGWRAVQESLSA